MPGSSVDAAAQSSSLSESQALALIADVVSVVRGGRFEWISPAVTALLGWAPDDVIGRPMADFVHPDDGALRADELPVSPGQVVTGRRVRVRRSDGRYTWVQSRLTRHFDPDGTPGPVLMSTRDITEIIDAEEHAASAEATMQAALRASPDGFAVYWVHRDAAGQPLRFTVLQLNPAAGAANPDIEDVVGMDLLDFTPDALETGIVALLRRAAAGGQPQRLRTAFFRRGRKLTVDCVAVRIEVDTVLTTWRDVSEQALSEEILVDALRRAETAQATLQTALDATTDSIVLYEVHPDDDTGPDGGPAITVAHANRVSMVARGLDRDRIVGWELSEVIPNCDPRIRAAIIEAVATRTVQRLRLDLVGPDSATVTGDATIAPVDDTRVLCIARDVTADERARRALDARRRHAEHAAHHDPLTSLPNRARLEQVLRQALLGCPPDRRVGVVFCDVNGVKAVNDTHGHRTGDVLLRTVASRLSELVLVGQTVSRLAGGVFVLVLPDLPPDWTADHLVQRLRDHVGQRVETAGVLLEPRLALGVHLADPARNSADREPAEVLATADLGRVR